MKFYACIDAKWGIGKNGKLLIRIPNDVQFLKREIEDQIVIMGRKTLDSLPGGKPLHYVRKTIVLTRNNNYTDTENIVYLHSRNEVCEYLEKIGCVDTHKVCVLGGAEIYKEFLPLATAFYITKVYHDFNADTFFPNIEAMGRHPIGSGQLFYYDGIPYELPILY